MGRPLEDLEIKKGGWEYTTTFNEVDVANAWGLLPFQFWALSEAQKAVMVEYVSSKSRMTAWEDQESSKKLDKDK